MLNFVGSREILFFLRAVDNIRMLHAQHLLVGRNHDHFQLVDLVELCRFSFRRTGHASQLLEHAEVILEGDGCKSLILAFDLDVFLGLDRLMQAIGPPPARHHAPGEFVDDDDFAVFDDIFDISTIERMRLDRGLDVVFQRPVLRVGDVADAEQSLHLLPTLIGDRNVAMLLVHHEVAGELRGLPRRPFDLFTLFELRNNAVHAVVLVRRFLTRARDDERRASLIDQDRVNLIDDGVVVSALHAVLEVELHIVAQIVEAELVVGAVGDIGRIGGAALVVIQIVDDYADAESEEAVQLAHPLGIALGQVVVDRDHMHAAPAKRIEINRKRGDQRLAFAGLHF